jgi:hypothetical protein
MGFFRKRKVRSEPIMTWGNLHDTKEGPAADAATPQEPQSYPGPAADQTSGDMGFLGTLAAAAAENSGATPEPSTINTNIDDERLEKISRRINHFVQRVELLERKIERIERRVDLKY